MLSVTKIPPELAAVVRWVVFTNNGLLAIAPMLPEFVDSVTVPIESVVITALPVMEPPL